MIVLDYSAISLAVVFTRQTDFVFVNPDGETIIKDDLLRHCILNSIRMYNLKYRDEYGQMVLACDSKSWRYRVFPEYKASRKSGREADTLDWSKVFGVLNQITEEIAENLPYTVLRVDGAEADDIIATLVHSTQEFGQHEPVMIVSGDKDFIQLQKYSNVKQFSPAQKKLVSDKNPERFLFEHICRGDGSDGVPNILSDDRTFVDGGRQTPVRAKKINEWYDAYKSGQDLTSVMDSNTYRNYCRNKSVIDLENIPNDIDNKIRYAWDNKTEKTNAGILNYLISKRCTNLISCVDEFFIKN